MSGIAVKVLDSAGGAQLAGGQSTWEIDGQPVVLLGDPVSPHGDSPHSGAVMVTASQWMSINGVPVCRAGDMANCGHPTTGRPWFDIE